LGTLYFSDSQHSELRDSVRAFYAQTPRLAGLHVSTVRTYLLHGTPGSGKTSLVHCLASEMGYGLATLAFGPGMTDADVAAALNRVPPRCLVLIEDIDCAFSGRSATEHGVTFSSLLSALDGAWTEQPQAIFLTTNHAAQLDAALRRRVDYVMRFGPATRPQVERMVGAFFDQPQTPEDIEKVWDTCKGASMSVVQKYLVKVMDADSCACRLDVLRELVECADPSFGADKGLTMYG
jgi:chaperone BCS1